jgi:hypothetical protein
MKLGQCLKTGLPFYHFLLHATLPLFSVKHYKVIREINKREGKSMMVSDHIWKKEYMK